MSIARALGAETVSNATAAGSALGCPLTIAMLRRCAQVSSCSMAAARKVSAAPTKTFLPMSENRLASFATEVVLPLPLTPTIKNDRWFAWQIAFV